MMIIYFYGSIIAAMVLYAITLSAIKGIRDNKDIGNYQAAGALCVGFIMFSIFVLCGR